MLNDLFTEFGQITSVYMEVDPYSAVPLGIATVSFAGDPIEAGNIARLAQLQLDGHQFEGSRIRVQFDPDGKFQTG